MKGVFIACIAAVSFTVLAADAPPLELKGIRIGDTEADVLKDRASYMVCRSDDPGPFKRICSRRVIAQQRVKCLFRKKKRFVVVAEYILPIVNQLVHGRREAVTANGSTYVRGGRFEIVNRKIAHAHTE